MRRRKGHIEINVIAGQSSVLACAGHLQSALPRREAKVLVVVLMVLMVMASKPSATVVVGEIPNSKETAHSTITSECTAE